jgi:hypothetical protein
MSEVVEKIYLINFMARSSRLWYILGVTIHNFRPSKNIMISKHYNCHSRYHPKEYSSTPPSRVKLGYYRNILELLGVGVVRTLFRPGSITLFDVSFQIVFVCTLDMKKHLCRSIRGCSSCASQFKKNLKTVH